MQRLALGLRIEERNAQISTLRVENLRIRVSEFALGSQLKKKREKSQRISIDDSLRCVSILYMPGNP
jgi:hypothetical protein